MMLAGYGVPMCPIGRVLGFCFRSVSGKLARSVARRSQV